MMSFSVRTDVTFTSGVKITLVIIQVLRSLTYVCILNKCENATRDLS